MVVRVEKDAEGETLPGELVVWLIPIRKITAGPVCFEIYSLGLCYKTELENWISF